MDIDQSATFYNVSLTSKEFPGLATEIKYTAYIIACTSITCRQSDGVEICKCAPPVLPILFPFLCLVSRSLHNSSSFLCSLLLPLSFLFAFPICISPPIFLPSLPPQLTVITFSRPTSFLVSHCNHIWSSLPPHYPPDTSNIQSATVTFSHTDVYLTCTFTTGSAATGCHFTLSLANTTQFFNISRNSQNMCFPTHNQRWKYLLDNTPAWHSTYSYAYSVWTTINCHLSRDAYTDIEVTAIDSGGNVVGVAQVPNITEDDSLPGCSSSDSSEQQPHIVLGLITGTCSADTLTN